MIVHFIGSARNIEVDLPYIEKVFEVVNNNGGRIIRDWPHAAVSRYQRGMLPDNNVDWHEVFKEQLEAIKQSDIIIAEISTYNFNQGYFLCTALQENKPTLLVTRQNLRERSVSGIRHDMLTTKQYQTIEELETLVDTFLKTYKNNLADNISLSPQARQNLATLANKSGENPGKILEDLINREIS